LQQLDIDDDEIAYLIAEFYDELNAVKLVAHDITNMLEIVKT